MPKEPEAIRYRLAGLRPFFGLLLFGAAVWVIHRQPAVHHRREFLFKPDRTPAAMVCHAAARALLKIRPISPP